MSKKIPLRQCVGCGEMKNKKEMLRVLKTEDEGIVLDTTCLLYTSDAADDYTRV